MNAANAPLYLKVGAYKKKSPLPILGGVVTLMAFAYFVIALMVSPRPLNPATWILWSILDCYLWRRMVHAKHESRNIMFGLFTGATIVAGLLFIYVETGEATWKWGGTEWLTLTAFIGAVSYGLLTVSENQKVNSGTIAMFIAGIPTVVLAFQLPEGMDPLFWGMCTFGCILTWIGTERSFTGWLFPVGGTILNGSIAALAIHARM